jgi:hypothetical protein
MKIATTPLAILALATTALLSGCVGGTLTASADLVASTAEDALEQSVGTRPAIDCGTEDFPIVNDTKRTCLLTDPTSGLEYDATVTIIKVDGANFSVDVQVADAPNNPPVDDTGTTTTPNVPSSDLAALASSALAGELGFTPEITCPPGDVQVVVDTAITCSFADPDSVDHDVLITITEFDGSSYSISALVTT